MKIAIIGSFNFHLECIGFLLEIYNNNNTIDIYLKKNIDRYNFCVYYLTMYHFNVIYDSFSEDIINNYDKIFKLTSNDYCLDHKKIISILHLNGASQKRCKSDKFISLTPYVHGDNIYYIMPIYRPILYPLKMCNTVTMIGYYTNNNFDNDTIDFINTNINYHFNFIIWGSPSYPNLNGINNITIFSGIKTNAMHNLINDSKYILSKKYINYDRFSGQLALAISYEKPLIIDIKTKETYKFPGITFNKNYSEVGDLDDIPEEKYNSLKNEIKSLKDSILDNNKTIFNSL